MNVDLSVYDVPGVPDVPGFREGAGLFDDVELFIRRFCILPSEAAYVAVTLWVVHCHCLDAFGSSPRLALLSPEPGSGKTRVLEIVALLVPNPMMTFNVSVAVLYRSMMPNKEGDTRRPTILLDEADTVFGPRASKDHEDLRGFVNAGYRRGSTAQRVGWKGKEAVIETFPSFAAVCLAGLDDLPDTIMTRAVVIRMRRRAPNERVEPYRERLYGAEGHALADQLAEWGQANMDPLKVAYPDLPESITDRAADVWEPLIAIADAFGDDWPERARQAAVEFVKAAEGQNTSSLNLRLLAALRDIYNTEDNPAQLSTSYLIDQLCNREDEPWGSGIGRSDKPLDAQGLAYRLRKYDIHPAKYRDGNSTVRGYHRTDLADAWERYLPPLPPPTPESWEHPEQVEQVGILPDSQLPSAPVHGCSGPSCRTPGCPEGQAT